MAEELPVWVRVGNTFGLPALMLFAVLWGIYNVALSLGTPVINSFVDYMGRQADLASQQTQRLDIQTKILQDIEVIVRQDQLENKKDLMLQNYKLIQEIQDSIESGFDRLELRINNSKWHLEPTVDGKGGNK